MSAIGFHRPIDARQQRLVDRDRDLDGLAGYFDRDQRAAVLAAVFRGNVIEVAGGRDWLGMLGQQPDMLVGHVDQLGQSRGAGGAHGGDRRQVRDARDDALAAAAFEDGDVEDGDGMEKVAFPMISTS